MLDPGQNNINRTDQNSTKQSPGIQYIVSEVPVRLTLSLGTGILALRSVLVM